jgi:hypothetical protein
MAPAHWFPAAASDVELVEELEYMFPDPPTKPNAFLATVFSVGVLAPALFLFTAVCVVQRLFLFLFLFSRSIVDGGREPRSQFVESWRACLPFFAIVTDNAISFVFISPRTSFVHIPFFVYSIY